MVCLRDSIYDLILHSFLASRIVPIIYIFLPNLYENFTQIIRREQDLHVFILDEEKSTLQQFMKMFGVRSRSDREYWLLDVSYVHNPEEKLQDLSLDLDDDLFWYSFIGDIAGYLNSNNASNFAIDLWEVYRIHDERNIIKVSGYHLRIN